MGDKPPRPDSMLGEIKTRKPKGVEGQSAIERMSRKLRPIEQKEEDEQEKKKTR